MHVGKEQYVQFFFSKKCNNKHKNKLKLKLTYILENRIYKFKVYNKREK